MSIPGYRLLSEFDIECHRGGLSLYYPTAELIWHKDALGWIVRVATWRGNIYDILIEYPRNFPDHEPRAWIDPRPVLNPHLYIDGSLCVHGGSWSKAQHSWTPVVGFTNARAWLEMYEDWLLTGRPWGPSIPQDIKDRLQVSHADQDARF